MQTRQVRLHESTMHARLESWQSVSVGNSFDFVCTYIGGGAQTEMQTQTEIKTETQTSE